MPKTSETLDAASKDFSRRAIAKRTKAETYLLALIHPEHGILEPFGSELRALKDELAKPGTADKIREIRARFLRDLEELKKRYDRAIEEDSGKQLTGAMKEQYLKRVSIAISFHTLQTALINAEGLDESAALSADAAKIFAADGL